MMIGNLSSCQRTSWTHAQLDLQSFQNLEGFADESLHLGDTATLSRDA
jgi:hypothetical protein